MQREETCWPRYGPVRVVGQRLKLCAEDEKLEMKLFLVTKVL